MKLGIFTPLFGKLGLDAVLARVREAGLEAIEIGTGGYPGQDHIEVDELLSDASKARDYRQTIQDHGLIISALSCHGNPLHPDESVARAHDEVFRKTVRLAERLEVPVVITFSGCPGDSEGSRYPNWVTCPWPPDFLKILEWQWEQKVIPYWQDAAAFARHHGRQVAIEAHPGFVVYNAETALKLRQAAGETIGVNVDPSHLFWQGVDVPAAIRVLGEAKAILHFHAKDVQVFRPQVAINGIIDPKSYTEMGQRAWLFRTVGTGHDALAWREIMGALRMVGYDYVISIEHEDALASIDEGFRGAVEFLRPMILRDPPAKAWWT